LRAAGSAHPADSAAAFHSPSPALIAWAAEHRLPIEGIDARDSAAALRSGDFVTVLFTLTEPVGQQQWLGEFRVVEMTAEEHQKDGETATVYTSTGSKFEFKSGSAALELRMFGPFDSGAKLAAAIPEKHARMIIKTDFLGAGFDRNCEVARRLFVQKIDLPFASSVAPFPPARIAKDKATAESCGLRPEDERAMAATNPALGQFLSIAQHTPGLKELMFRIADSPPLWAYLTGLSPGTFFEPLGMRALDGREWNLEGSTVYRAPFQFLLNGHPAIKGVFYFAPAQSPLLTCAGIVGLTATSPKQPENTLELRVLAARRVRP
jgi:hypothetical protein